MGMMEHLRKQQKVAKFVNFCACMHLINLSKIPALSTSIATILQHVHRSSAYALLCLPLHASLYHSALMPIQYIININYITA